MLTNGIELKSRDKVFLIFFLNYYFLEEFANDVLKNAKPFHFVVTFQGGF
jgi:hypothetical protein